jgi:hypothetical protein
MFNGKIYMTAGVKERIPTMIQLLIIEMLEYQKEKISDIDYLQVIIISQISEGDYNLKIEHTQETVVYKNIIMINVEVPFEAKLYFISDEDENSEEFSTMFLASEY